MKRLLALVVLLVLTLPVSAQDPATLFQCPVPYTGNLCIGAGDRDVLLMTAGTPRLRVDRAGAVTFLSGTTAISPAVGVGTSYKIARGATAFDGSNPTPVATGLTAVDSCTATLRLAAAVNTGTALVTHAAPSGANVDFYAWVIAGTASTGTETFDWICIGT